MNRDSVPDELLPELPEDFRLAREKCCRIMGEFQDKRLAWYKKGLSLKEVLSKDLAMFAARGVDNPDDLIAEAFRAKESSSEETVMGNAWQKMLATISENTLDTGDLTTDRDGVLWVCEVKSQTNTANSSSFPQELRGLRTRMNENRGRRRASSQPVRAAYCVVRDSRNNGKGVDEIRTYACPDLQPENRDLEGFEYRYITGKAFWKWLTGFESELALLMPLSELHGTKSEALREARKNAIKKLQEELRAKLRQFDLPFSIDSVVTLRDTYL